MAEWNPFAEAPQAAPAGAPSAGQWNPFAQPASTPSGDSKPQSAPAASGAEWNPFANSGQDPLGGIGAAVGGALRHGARAVVDSAANTLGAIGNFEQSVGGQRSISRLIAGQGAGYAPTLGNEDQDYTGEGLQRIQDATGIPGVAMGAGDGLGDRFGNTVKRFLYETLTDPVTYASMGSKPILGGALDLAKGGLRAVAEQLGVDSLARGVAAKAAKSNALQQTADFFGVNTKSKRLYGDALNAQAESVESKHANLRELAKEARMNLIDRNLEGIMDAEETADAARAEFMSGPWRGAGEALSMTPRDLAKPVLPPEVADALNRAAWIERVPGSPAEAALQAGWQVPADLADHPGLGILEHAQTDYVPSKEALSPEARSALGSVYDAARGMNTGSPISFTMRADGEMPASSRLLDRLNLRFEQSEALQQTINTRREGLPLFGIPTTRPASTAYYDALLENLPRAGVDADSDALRSTLNNLRTEAKIKNSLAQGTVRGAIIDSDPTAKLKSVYDPFFYSDQVSNPIHTADLSNLSAERRAELAQQYDQDVNTVHMPQALYERFYEPQEYGAGVPDVFRNFADLKREALFTLPWGHKLNIGSLQLQGPGGFAALKAGLNMGDEAALARLPELAQMGAMGMAKHGEAQTWIRNVPGLGDLWQRSQHSLGLFDAKQRLALHDRLLGTDAAYQAMNPLERGARLNDVLFDYNHSSPFAQTLRRLGSAFPGWRTGNVAVQARRWSEDPTRQLTLARMQNEAQRSSATGSSPEDPNGWQFRLNTPLMEGSKFGFDTLGAGLNPMANQWLMSTLGLSNGDRAGNLLDQAQSDGLRGIAERAAASVLPLGSSLEDLFGISPFKSKAPTLLKALGDTVNLSTKNNTSPFGSAVEGRMADDDLSRMKATARQLKPSHRYSF